MVVALSQTPLIGAEEKGVKEGEKVKGANNHILGKEFTITNEKLPGEE